MRHYGENIIKRLLKANIVLKNKISCMSLTEYKTPVKREFVK